MLESDSEEEDNAAASKEEEKRRQEEEERKRLEEEVKPTEWGCEICTFINPMSDAACGICGQGRRPSMEQLMAAVRAQRQEELKQASGENEGDAAGSRAAGEDPVPSESALRLKYLARDLSKFVKVEQKRLRK